jgi:CDP-diacylglycerol--glycerol-3-phosphate 3-phosphatidyltransferase
MTDAHDPHDHSDAHEEAEEAAAEARETAELEFGNLPNFLTLMRMVMVPAVVALMFLKTPVGDALATWFFAIASITDYFDGYLARTRKAVTLYGKLMDPLADKFLVVSTLVMLQYLDRVHPVLVILLICRELAITGLRALASAEGVVIAASTSAKWKTATQMVAIPCLMYRPGLFGFSLVAEGQILIYISLAISLWTAKDYVVGFFVGLAERRKIRAEERKKKREARKAARLARRTAKV